MTAVIVGCNGASTVDTASITTCSFASGQQSIGALIVAFIAITPWTPASIAPKGGPRLSVGSVGFDLVCSGGETTNNRVFCFVGSGPNPSGGSENVVLDLTGTCTGFAACIYLIPNMTKFGRAAIRQSGFQETGAPGGTPAVSFPLACLTSNPVLAALVNGTNPGGVTHPAGLTSRSNTGYATPTTGFTSDSADGGIVASTITWGSTSASGFGAVAVELDLGVDYTANDAAPVLEGQGALQ